MRNKIEHDLVYVWLLFANYELLHAIWITLDTLQGVEFVATLSDTLACSVLSILMTNWILKVISGYSILEKFQK